uniref:Uncharacterized protein n=1 Tax=Arion vulgaris TaxID=1028688 RepID=A0A0B6ZIT4_9EUPU
MLSYFRCVLGKRLLTLLNLWLKRFFIYSEYGVNVTKEKLQTNSQCGLTDLNL